MGLRTKVSGQPGLLIEARIAIHGRCGQHYKAR
jgi:hypothetical protein